MEELIMALEQEAEQYAENEIKRGDANDKVICSIDFIAGANSTFTQKEVIQYKW